MTVVTLIPSGVFIDTVTSNMCVNVPVQCFTFWACSVGAGCKKCEYVVGILFLINNK